MARANVRISTSAAPAKVNIGEPITLTITIEGDYLKPVRWPELGEIASPHEAGGIPFDQ